MHVLVQASYFPYQTTTHPVLTLNCVHFLQTFIQIVSVELLTQLRVPDSPITVFMFPVGFGMFHLIMSAEFSILTNFETQVMLYFYLLVQNKKRFCLDACRGCF